MSVWHYSDSDSTARKGPVPEVVLCRLLEKGIGVSAQTLVWKQGMETWQAMSNVSPFQQIIYFNQMQWFYVDIEGQRKGPVHSKQLVHKLRVGDIDGLSLVYGNDTAATEWKKVSEVPILKAEMAKIAVEEENARITMSGGATEDDLKQQVFDFENSGINNKEGEEKFLLGDKRKLDNDDDDDEVEEDNVKDVHKDDIGGEEEGEEEEEKCGADQQQHGVGVEGHAAANPENAAEDLNANSKPKRKRSKKKSKKGPTTWVYVTGLPPDITVEEIKDHFSKVGLIAISPYDQQPKIKIYRDKEVSGQFNASDGDGGGGGNDSQPPCKGDCSLCYNAPESVELAVTVLSGGYIRPNSQVTVTRAEFSVSTQPGPVQTSTAGGGDPNSTATGSTGNSGGVGGSSSSSSRSNGRRPALSQAQVKVAKNAMKQALAWNEDDDIGVSRAAALRIIVLEGLFQVSDFNDPNFAVELEQDLASECEKCGTIEKITIFSSNPRGISVVKFATSYAAQECINLMNGRFFGGTKLKCFFWDGVTNYSVTAHSHEQEEEEERQEDNRLEEFGDWLDQEQEELPEEFQLRTE
mmetsp:Transcript_28224/g.47464  ORF Transcript_28224/g.47464 Transcript_28224/m.47464 type:complete len:579 (+) Transcript_28224:54-1790(+)